MNISHLTSYYMRLLPDSEEFKIVLAIARRAQKRDDRVKISEREISRQTGISYRTVGRRIKSLGEQGIILKCQRCAECGKDIDISYMRCPKCAHALTKKVLLFRVMNWPDAEDQPVEERLIEETLDEKKILVGVREEMREQHVELQEIKETIYEMNGKISEMSESIQGMRQDIQALTGAITALVGVLSGNTQPKVGVTEGAASNSSPLSDTESAENTLFLCPEEDTNCVESGATLQQNGAHVYSPSLNSNKLELDALASVSERSVNAESTSERNKKPMSNVNRRCDEQQSMRAEVKRANGVKVMGFLLKTLEKFGGSIDSAADIARAAELFDEELVRLRHEYARWARDAEAGMAVSKMKNPQEKIKRASFTIELLKHLHPDKDIQQALVMQQINQRGFQRYVQECVAFAGQAKTFNRVELAPKTLGVKQRLDNWN